MDRREALKFMALALGAGVSGSLSSRLLAGEVPVAGSAKSPFKGNSRKTVAILTEMIIPKTDTPGAIEAGVPTFVETMVADWYTDSERKIFMEGPAALETHCREQFGQSFLGCDADRRIEALKAMEVAARSYKSSLPAFSSGRAVDEGTPFFTKLKDLTVVGYYTSEVGARQELSYDPMPMAYEGDYDFSKTGRQWSW